jgi:hypothetical protein
MVNDYLLNALIITMVVIGVLFVLYLISLVVGKIIRTAKTKIGTLKWSIDSTRECGEWAHRRIDDVQKSIFEMHDEIEKLKGEKKNVKKKKRN